MPASWNIIWSTGSSEPPVFAGGGRTRVLEVRRHPRARAMRLAVDPRDGAVRLTLPPRAGLARAFAWAETKRAWVEGALAALAPPTGIAPGTVLPFAGDTLRIDWAEAHPRAAVRSGDALRVGGPLPHLGPRVLRWLKAEAARTLAEDTAYYAALAGVAVTGIRVGDPKSRWGSCSSAGDIRYSWRLILAPPEVRRATVAHEVAHRLHMDHSAAFHAAVARLYGRDPAAERRWLRAHGASLWAVNTSHAHSTHRSP